MLGRTAFSGVSLVLLLTGCGGADSNGLFESPSDGTGDAGANVGGSSQAGTGGAGSGGTNTGGSETGGTNTGGTNTGGTNAGGTNAGGTNAGGTNTGGTNTGGTNTGGTNAGGTNSGGTNSGGTNTGGTNTGGTNTGGTNTGGSGQVTPGHVLCGTAPCDVWAGNVCCKPLGGFFPGGGFPTCLNEIAPCVSTEFAPAVEIECDGPEDCAPGDVCCGEYDIVSTGDGNGVARYTQLSCKSSCGSIQDEEAVICGNSNAGCRPGEFCRDSTVLEGYRICVQP